MDGIVVGVDGSTGSRAALKWAIAEAELRGLPVHAIHTFHVPYSGGSTVVPLMLDRGEFEEAAKALLIATLERVGAEAAEVTQHVVEGPAAMVLVDAGKDAEMIVVGARGHGGLAGMLLGSVSRQVSEHAAVPVVVVPEEKT